METLTAAMERHGSNSFKILTLVPNFVILSQKKMKEESALGLNFGDLVMLNNSFYERTLAIYLGYWSEPITPNNKLPQHWFLAQNEVRPHYYGDGGLMTREDLVKYGIRRILIAKLGWVRQFLRRIR